MWENPNAREIDHLKIIEKKKMEAEEQKNRKNQTSLFNLIVVLLILLLISVCCTFSSIYTGTLIKSNELTDSASIPQEVTTYNSTVHISAVRSSVDPTIVWIKNTNAMMTFKDGTTSTTRVSTCENTTFCTMSIDWSNLSTVSIRVCMYPENPQDNPPCQTIRLLQTTETILLKVDG